MDKIMNKGINVLSLFDGISCGQIALQRAGIRVDKYFASEIDKHAIKVTQHNYPDTIQLGDATKVRAEELPKIDLLIGGSPCQGFSFAGKQLNFEDQRSKLFFEYVRLVRECKPSFFLLENVKMKKESEKVISEYLGVEPIEINSALVSAQNRRRLYWTNIPNVQEPDDRLVKIKDVIDDPKTLIEDNILIRCRKHGYFKERIEKINKIPALVTGNTEYFPLTKLINEEILEEIGKEGVKTVFEEKLKTWSCEFRKLTTLEYEKLQTIPAHYTDCIKPSRRFHAIGNGWTVDVIAHIFSFLPEEFKNE